jgi:hypothetical protein
MQLSTTREATGCAAIQEFPNTEPEGSLPHSQEPSIGPYSDPVHTTPS